MNVKVIQTDAYPPITSIKKEMDKTRAVLHELLHDKFNSEHNTNTHEYAIEVLDSYCYVPNEFTLWHGRYVRYLDTNDPFEMTLKMGGFLLSDNGYTAVLKNNKNPFKVDKRGKIFFMIMTNNDLERLQMNKIMSYVE